MTVSHGQLTGLNAIQSLTVPTGASSVLLQAETQNIRYTMDGSNPSASNGLLLIAGQEPTRFAGNFSGLKFLESAASAKLNYAFQIDRTLA